MVRTGRTKHQKARCRCCGWKGTVNYDGGMRKHPLHDKFGNLVTDECAGSHRPPHGQPETTEGATPT